MKNWVKRKWCDWTHGGGDVKRDTMGLINWQCRKCGRWSDPVPKSTENAVIDSRIMQEEVKRFISERQLAQKFGYTIPQAPDSMKYDENGCDRS